MRTTVPMISAFKLGLALAGGHAGLATASLAATFGDLSAATTIAPTYVAGPYAMAPCPPNCGALPGQNGGVPQGYSPNGAGPGQAPYGPMPAQYPNPSLPFAPADDLPRRELMQWSFGQVNTSTDPYNPWGLSTPFMYVPWSTPLSGWTNAQTWNWWRERSGAPPQNW